MSNIMREKTIDDIVEYLNNGGLLDPIEEFEFTKEHNAFKYLGYKDSQHVYLAAFELDDEYVASLIFVYLGRSGKLEADYSAMPVFESMDMQEVLDYVEKRCQI